MQQPESATAALGDEVMFGVIAENADSYRWQYSTNEGASWINIATTWNGYNSDVLIFNSTNTRFNYLYRCAITGNDVTIYSDVVQINRI